MSIMFIGDGWRWIAHQPGGQVNASIPRDYAQRIKKLRGRLGLTQTQLAEKLGVSFASVNRWENGQSRPSRLAWQRLETAERLGLEAFGESSSPSALEPQSDERPATTPLLPPLDFTSQPEAVRAVVEAHWLAEGYRTNPAFAIETSLVDPLPHQRLAVYERMLRQPRLRFLLADDAGAGKTIMAGLYIREMLSRKLLRRVLIVVPAGLVGNWYSEMHTLFRLPFAIVRGSDAKAGNPFVGPDSNLLIVSIDTLASERMFKRLQEPETEPYDLAIFDEAHKLSASRDPDGTFRATDRYRVGEALAGVPEAHPKWRLRWAASNLLLLTATPHMGKDEPYFYLWRLLDPLALTTREAFDAFPPEARAHHFIRRTKEEMVKLDGRPLYPTRISDTLSFDLSAGEVSEQALYDQTSKYISEVYNRARILNRTAARFAMSIFQRRLASSTWALLRSFDRRIDKLDRLVDDIRSGRISEEDLFARQQRLDRTATDPFDETTADEEETKDGEEGTKDGEEESESKESETLGGVVATSLAELMVEKQTVLALRELAQAVYDQGRESKFEELRKQVSDARYAGEKLIVFTEHRDTLEFLVRRFEALGFTGQIASIHGGLSWQERERQVELFRKPSSQGGANFLIATDAAGEGINLQFCWRMVNYDIPWNPARLEQRMGRIHRYKQQHDPVMIINLVAGKTREGSVLKTLLDKLEKIRLELGSDKVFDVVGRVFESVSIKEYMERALTAEGATSAASEIEGTLTKQQVEALEARERALYGEGGDVRRELPRLRGELEQEVYRRLLPGYVRRFVERVVPLLGLRIEGDLDGTFTLAAERPGAMDALWRALESYPEPQRNALSTQKPDHETAAVFLHPGEVVFDTLASQLTNRFAESARRGAIFVDPSAQQPYLLHIGTLKLERTAPPDARDNAANELLEQRLIALKQTAPGEIVEIPVETLALLRPGDAPPAAALGLVAMGRELCGTARAHAMEQILAPMVAQRRAACIDSLPERENFMRRGFDFQDADLALRRARLAEKARGGNAAAQAELTRIREQQRDLTSRRERALEELRREPEAIGSGELTFLAHALVVPAVDPEEKMRFDADVEAIAVRVAWAFEEACGATVRDVSKPALARDSGVPDWPGFDLLSRRPHGEERAIEVKGRAGVGDVELKENEWAKACNLRERYWLYVVYDCASAQPRLLRIGDPFGRLIAKAKGTLVVTQHEIIGAAEDM
jgi:superfamily II DNA or RNA helicase